MLVCYNSLSNVVSGWVDNGYGRCLFKIQYRCNLCEEREGNRLNQECRLSTERTDLFIPNINVVMKVEIGGKPDIALLKQAINHAVNANEALLCKIVLLENGDAGYEKLENPMHSIVVSNKDWKGVTREQESKVFNLAAGELVRFFLLTGGNDVEVLIIAHHLVGDGLALVCLIEDIMTALSGNKLKYKPLQLVSVNNFPKNSELNPISKVLLKRINRNWMKSGRVFTMDDYEKMFENYWKNRKTYIFYDKLSPNELGRIREKARQSDVSLNSLMTTAFIRAYEKKADTGLAVSIREKEYRGMANHASGIAVQYKYNENKSIFQNAQIVHKLIYKKLGNAKKKYLVLRFIALMEPTLLDSVCMFAFGDYKNKTTEQLTHMMKYDNQPKNLSVTNLTKLNIPQRYGLYDIKNFVFVAPIFPNSRRVIGIATLGEETCITMHVMDDENVKNERRIFEKAIQTLKEIE